MWLAKAQKQWLVASLFVSFTGCTPLSQSAADSGIQSIGFAIDTATIAAVNQPSNVNAIVQVKGKVVNRAPLLGKTAYELQDTTGSIWVLATDPIPNSGDAVVVKGKLLYQTIPLNGKEQGSTYIEQQQLQPTADVKGEVDGLKAEG